MRTAAGRLMDRTGMAAFVASDWGTVVTEFDFSATSTITSSGGAVSGVTPKSGSQGIDVVQSTASLKPTTGTRSQNGLNVLDFTGSTQVQRLVSASNPPDVAQPCTVAIVLKSDNVDSANRQAWANGYGGSTSVTVFVNADTYSMYAGNVATSGVTEDANPHVIIATFNGASSDMRIDNVSHSLNPSVAPCVGINLGDDGSGGFAWDGWIGHAILYSGAVANASGLSGALNTKWAVY